MWEYWIIAGIITFIIAMSIWRHQSAHIKEQTLNPNASLVKAASDQEAEIGTQENPFIMDAAVSITPVIRNDTPLEQIAKKDSIFETMAKAEPKTALEFATKPQSHSTEEVMVLEASTPSKAATETPIEVNMKTKVHVSVPKVEFVHQYDSAFYDNERGTFCFPRFLHIDKFMVKIIDKTPYKTIAGLGRKQSQHNYSLSQFESTFKSSDLQLEVEPLSALFSKNPNNILGSREFLKGNWQLVSDLLRTESAHRPDSFEKIAKEDAIPYVKVYAKLHDMLLESGLIEEYLPKDETMRRAYINDLSVPEIKVLCKEAKIPVGKKLKDELVAELQKVADTLTLPKAAVPSSFFYEFINHLFDKYIEDMAQNLNRFHPMYVNAAWQAARQGALNEKLFALSHKLEALQEE